MDKSDSKFAKWMPLVVLSSALMIIIIDTTVLNVSIEQMVGDLNTNVKGIQWVISSYALTLAALTVTGGRLGDLFGRKKMFITGAILFALGSLVTSFAPTIAWVIFGNALVEGVGAALMMPATSSLLVSTYSGRERAFAFSVWGSIAASAAAIGPVLGGFLTTTYSWRWAFRINLFVVAFLLIGAKYIKESRDKGHKIELDFIGILLSSVGLASLVYGVIESSGYGWWIATRNFAVFGYRFMPFGLSITPIAIFAGVSLIVLFLQYEKKHEEGGHIPLVSLGLFQNHQFRGGVFTTMVLGMGQSGLVFVIPIFYQAVKGYDAFHTGLGMLPVSIAVLVGAPVSLQLTKKLTPKRMIQIGFVTSTLGLTLLFFALDVNATVFDLAPGMFLYGLGMGFGFINLSNMTLSAVRVSQSGEASGVNNTIRQVGASFGAAIIGAALLVTLSSNAITNIQDSKVIPQTAKSSIVKHIEEQGSNVEFQAAEKPIAPPVIQKEINSSINKATVDAGKRALLLIILFSSIALLFSTVLPNIKDLEANAKEAAVH
jgi:EmrB/QacA subfamily drug resistance transporter